MEIKELLQLLKEERLKRNVTQGEVAQHLNVDVSAISLYESGKRPLNIETLDKWLEFFNLKFMVVDYNTKEVPKPTIEDVATFKKLKQERNSLIQEYHLKQIEYLQSRLPEKKFIATGKMNYVALLDQMITYVNGDIAVIYYDNVLINATFDQLYHGTYLNDEPVGSLTTISEFLNTASIDHINFERISGDYAFGCSEGVILYEDNLDIYINDAKALNPVRLLEASNLLEKYSGELDSAIEYANQYLENFDDRIEELNHQIDETVEKWMISAVEHHPKFIHWSQEDFDATRIGMELTELDKERFKTIDEED